MRKPTLGVILTTFKCTASCPECCFECSPDNDKILSYEEIVKFIEQAHTELDVKRLVWSGGECFLLGDDLKKGIQYGYSLGINSRCVTNGFWATSEEVAFNKLKELRDVGLDEINFSTGDDHQLFVSEDKILNAVIAAAKLGLRVVVSIETRNNTRVSKESFINNFRYKREIENTKLKENVRIVQAVWVSYHKDVIYEYAENSEKYIGYKGCDSLFDSICLTPHKTVIGCCGLSVEYINEMTLGKFGGNLLEMYNKQAEDFLKVWLYVDGPKKILDYVKKWNPKLKIPQFVHICQACAYIYQNVEVQKVIRDNFKQCYSEILERFTAKQTLIESRNT